jgi:hypothetical protein
MRSVFPSLLLTFIAAMWFQDLFDYDFRRTERCIIPYATQEGEISFCAYNTGIGWRNIIERMHMTATLTKWYEEHGRHEIFAGGKKVGLETTAEAVNKGKQTDLDEKGIARTAHEEKLRARQGLGREQAHGRALAPGGARRRRGAAGARRRSRSSPRATAGCAQLFGKLLKPHQLQKALLGRPPQVLANQRAIDVLLVGLDHGIWIERDRHTG